MWVGVDGPGRCVMCPTGQQTLVIGVCVQVLTVHSHIPHPISFVSSALSVAPGPPPPTASYSASVSGVGGHGWVGVGGSGQRVGRGWVDTQKTQQTSTTHMHTFISPHSAIQKNECKKYSVAQNQKNEC